MTKTKQKQSHLGLKQRNKKRKKKKEKKWNRATVIVERKKQFHQITKIRMHQNHQSDYQWQETYIGVCLEHLRAILCGNEKEHERWKERKQNERNHKLG